MKRDKYELFKNFMHNELEITKEDIRLWIQESCQEEARKMIEGTWSKFSPEKVVKDVLIEQHLMYNDSLKETVIKEAGVILAKELLSKHK